uniref:Uncharacterized protein n=1 Tax=Oryza barthii TaxID=65489 RepID=A0A0D3H4L7_9ORYZ
MSSSATSREKGGHLPQGWAKQKRSRRQRSEEENLALCLLMLVLGGHHRVQAPPPFFATAPAPLLPGARRPQDEPPGQATDSARSFGNGHSAARTFDLNLPAGAIHDR